MKREICKDYFIDSEEGILFHKDESVLLNGLKLKIFIFLLKNKNIFVSRGDIIYEIWGKDDTVFCNSSLTQQIYLLRKSLESVGLKGRIKSSQREGYKLICPETLEDISYSDSEYAPTSSLIEFLKKLKKIRLNRLTLLTLIVVNVLHLFYDVYSSNGYLL